MSSTRNGKRSPDRLNGEFYLRLGETVFDDDVDSLAGGRDLDWFFFDSEDDRVVDLKDEVFANDLDFILSP